MVDWNLAAKVAEGVAGLQPTGDPEPFQALVRPADEAEALVSGYTGLVPSAGVLPVAESIDRKTWIDANLSSIRGVLEPAAAKAAEGAGPLGGVAGAAAGAVLGLQAGAISGFLAGRVMGQYEFPVLDPEAPARLLFVAPNLGHAASQPALTVDRFPTERQQVIRDRRERGIVGLEVLEEIEADDRVKFGMQAQRVEAGAVRGRNPQVAVDDPERCGDPRQGELAGVVHGGVAERGRSAGHGAQDPLPFPGACYAW